MRIVNQVIIGFVFVLILFSGVLLINFAENQKSRQLSVWFNHSEEVLKNTADMQKIIVEVQSNMRGYLLTGADTYLRPYKALEFSADSLLDKLKSSVKDNPRQEKRLLGVKDSLHSWFHAWDSTIVVYKHDMVNGGRSNAIEHIANRMVQSRSKKITRLRAQIKEFEHYEYKLRMNREQSLQKARTFGDVLSLALMIIAIIIGIFTFYILSTNIRKRIASISQGTQAIAAGDYSYRIHDKSNDELKEISEAINKMTASLEETITKLRQSNEDLEQFAWISSHDLKEPLRMVSIYTQIIATKYKGQIDDEAEIAIKYIVEGVKRMYVLINNLLEYARIGREGHDYEKTNMGEVIKLASLNLQAPINEAKAEIITGIMPDDVAGVKPLLIQLFQNLINNAVKFRGNEQPIIEIDAKRQSKRYYLFSVRDNGIGIDEKYKEVVFVIFQRLHDKEKYEGTGIGLANCKKIVELHQGQIWFESEQGQGTTFYFTLPVFEK